MMIIFQMFERLLTTNKEIVGAKRSCSKRVLRTVTLKDYVARMSSERLPLKDYLAYMSSELLTLKDYLAYMSSELLTLKDYAAYMSSELLTLKDYAACMSSELLTLHSTSTHDFRTFINLSIMMYFLDTQ